MNTRTTILLALTAALTLLASCSPSSKNSAQTFSNANNQVSANIIGGQTSTLDYQKANGIVGLMIVAQDRRGNQMVEGCTGSLIAPHIVVSAAHCLIAQPGTQIAGIIVVFTTNFEDAMKEVQQAQHGASLKVARLAVTGMVHEAYLKQPAFDNDISLTYFDGEIPDGFQFAQMPTAANTVGLVKGATLTLSGFGVSTEPQDAPKGSDAGAGVLRQIENMKIISIEPTAGKEITLDQTKGIGACHGDSGGPAYLVDANTQQNVLVGLTSRGTEKTGRCEGDVIYTSVLPYTQWIQDGIEKLNQQVAAAAKPGANDNGAVATGN